MRKRRRVVHGGSVFFVIFASHGGEQHDHGIGALASADVTGRTQ
jgi:hypothetical protein